MNRIRRNRIETRYRSSYRATPGRLVFNSRTFLSDKVIIALVFLSAVAFVFVDSPDIFQPKKAWAITNRFVPTELALTNFLPKAGSSNIAANLMDIPTVRNNPNYGLGGSVKEVDLIKELGQLAGIEAAEAERNFVDERAEAGSAIAEGTGRGLRITSSYGYRRFGGGVRHHDGVDVSMPYGATIRAHQDGVVTFSGWRSGYGNLVIIDHGGGKQTYYAHASRLRVRPGDVVSAGDPVANVGSTGRSFGPHLHFEIRYNGVPVDPEDEFVARGMYS